MTAQASMAQAMAKTSMAMGTMNQQMNIRTIQQMANTFETESTKMSMKSEMMDEVYDSVFEGDEEKESDIMNQIYDEIGLDYAQSAPAAPIKSPAQVSDEQVDELVRSRAPNRLDE